MGTIPDAREVGRRLRVLAKAVDLTAAGLAASIDMTPQAMSNFMTGRHLLTIEWAAKINARWGADPNWIFLGQIDGVKKWLADRLLDAEKEQSASLLKRNNA